MGYQTDFVGYLHVQPALNESEIALVNAISGHQLPDEDGALRSVDDEAASRLELESAAPCGSSIGKRARRGVA